MADGDRAVTVDGVCGKCGAVHDTSKCAAHAKRQGGGQCHAVPMVGQVVCSAHGGRSPQARGAATVRQVDEQIRTRLGTLTVTPVDNPLVELQTLAGEARAWKALCADHVANLERLRYSTDGGEQVRGEIVLFERAMDRCLAVLATIVKLNIDERLVRIREQQRDTILGAIEAALAAAGLTGPAVIEARSVAARHLRAVGN